MEDLMPLKNLSVGSPVVYIPRHKIDLKFDDDQLGVITSWNERYVFVRYIGKSGSQATEIEYLYSPSPDLIERIKLKL